MEFTQKPKVSLLNYTENMLELWCIVRRTMHSDIPNSVEELKKDPQKWLGMSVEDYINNVLLLDGMPTYSEYGSFTFKLENVSRALTHQLVRNRIGFSYSQQSMRCVPANEFATKGLYHCPDTVEDKEAYHKKMLQVQDVYNDAIKNGVSIQDARGLLPTNIYTSIVFACSPRAFFGMISKRMCMKTQGEFREVAEQMVKQVLEKVDPRLERWIGPPCKFGKCMMFGENNLQHKEGKLTGKQNTDHCCPIFVAKFVKKENLK